MNTEPFVIERLLDAPAEKVWKAITDKDQIKQWYFNLPEFRPEVGFEFSFTGTGNTGVTYVHLCTITGVIPGRTLSHTWQYKDIPGHSVVTFELFPKGNKTKLKLTHESLASFAASGQDFAKESFAAGWTYIVGTSLKNFLAKEN